MSDGERTYNTSVYIGPAFEDFEILQFIGIIGWHGHHSDISNHVLVSTVIIDHHLVEGMEHVLQLLLLPNSICSQNVIVLILVPIHVSHTKIVFLWHFQWSLSFLHLSRCGCPFEAFILKERLS